MQTLAQIPFETGPSSNSHCVHYAHFVQIPDGKKAEFKFLSGHYAHFDTNTPLKKGWVQIQVGFIMHILSKYPMEMYESFTSPLTAKAMGL